MALSEVVDPPDTIPRICWGPDDDRLIACAVSGQVDVIVRGDDDLLTLERVGSIPILTAAQFLNTLEPGSWGKLPWSRTMTRQVRVNLDEPGIAVDTDFSELNVSSQSLGVS
jgi:hypothetical protein